MECWPRVTAKETPTQGTTRMSLRGIRPSERRQTQEPAHRRSPFIGHSENSKTIGRESRSVASRGEVGTAAQEGTKKIKKKKIRRLTIKGADLN